MSIGDPRPAAIITVMLAIAGSSLLLGMVATAAAWIWPLAVLAALALLALAGYTARALIGGKM